jgi:uncharacterized protein YndB with AHSA1/START domain
MNEFKGQTSITIQAPVEKVYAYLVDFQRHPEWAQNLSKVTQISSGPIGAGTTFKTQEGPPPVPLGKKLKMMAHFMSGVFSGAKTYSEAKITALEANRRIAWQAGVPKGESYLSFAEWEFIFEPQYKATRLTQRFRYAPPDSAGQRMIGVAGVEGLERACAVSLAQLKRRLEQSSNGNH